MSCSRFINDTGLSIDIDPRSHLEVFDPRHRYSKNLRTYFKHYANNVQTSTMLDAESHLAPNLSDKTAMFQDFFRWLDENHEIPECPRASLDTEIVEYLNSDEARQQYVVDVDESGLLWQRIPNNSESSCATMQASSAGSSFSRRPLSTTAESGPYIFVIRGDTLFAAEKVTKTIPRFHHSSFFCGEAVEAAGQIVVRDGKLLELYPHSGHYRPQDKHLLHMISFFRRNYVPFDFKVDAQRLLKVSRVMEDNGVGDGGKKKKKKVEAAHLVDVQSLYDLLQYKSNVSSSGILNGITNNQIAARKKTLKHSDVFEVAANDENIVQNDAAATAAIAGAFKSAAAAAAASEQGTVVDASLLCCIVPTTSPSMKEGKDAPVHPVATSSSSPRGVQAPQLSLTLPMTPQYDLGGPDLNYNSHESNNSNNNHNNWFKVLMQDSPAPFHATAKGNGHSNGTNTNDGDESCHSSLAHKVSSCVSVSVYEVAATQQLQQQTLAASNDVVVGPDDTGR